jgi:hypothetical protein
MSNIERLDGFTVDGFGNVIPGEPQTGDVIRVDGRIEQRYAAPIPHTPKPITMTDKQFRKFVQNKLGAGVYGKAFRDASTSSDTAVMDAYAAWVKADTYDKAEVAAMTQALQDAGIITEQQRDALVKNGNWPEA